MLWRSSGLMMTAALAPRALVWCAIMMTVVEEERQGVPCRALHVLADGLAAAAHLECWPRSQCHAMRQALERTVLMKVR